jgi:hypothetical protein
MTESIELTRQAAALLRDVSRPALGERSMVALSDEDLCVLLREIEQVGRLTDMLRALAAAEVDDRSRYELGTAGLGRRLGYTKPSLLIERATLVSQGEASRRIRLGQAITPRTSFNGEPLPPRYPLVASAMADGAIGVDAATITVRCLDQAGARAEPELLHDAEESLVQQARTEPADLVAIHARVWREALDPDGAGPRDEELRRRRAFRVGREVGGMSPFHGWADPVSSALLRGMLSEGANPKAQPRFLSEEDARSCKETKTTVRGEVVVTLKDPRTREQRQFDILIGTITAGLRSTEMPGGLRSMTAVTAVVKLSDLEAGTGVGWLDDVTEPVSAATIQQLVCDGGLRKIVLGHDGEVLYLGVKERFFSASQRRALAVRDGGCCWPDCTAPPSWCEAHHVIEYEKGGKTDINNGVLLCSAHHHALHASEFTIKMINGKPRLLAPPWLDPDQLWQPLGRTRATMAA